MEETAEALHRGLKMDAKERRRRAQTMKAAVQRHDLRALFQSLCEDIPV